MLSIMRMQALHHFMRTQVLTSVLLLTLQARRSYSASNTVTIRNEAAFKAMRECARDCFVFNGSIDLIGEFGCIWPYMNECLCRADLAPQATKHLSTCCDTYCTGAADVDISSAIQVYYSYCSDNGYDVKASAEAAEAGIVPVKTTAASGNVATHAATTGQHAATSTPTETGGSSSSTASGSSGLSPGALAGIIAGPLGAIISVVGGFAIKWYWERKRAQRELGQKLPDTDDPGFTMVTMATQPRRNARPR